MTDEAVPLHDVAADDEHFPPPDPVAVAVVAALRPQPRGGGAGPRPLRFPDGRQPRQAVLRQRDPPRAWPFRLAWRGLLVGGSGVRRGPDPGRLVLLRHVLLPA